MVNKNNIKNGLETLYHGNGEKSSEIFYKDGKQHGYWIHWDFEGKKNADGFSIEGSTSWTDYHENGTIAMQRQYINYDREGLWIWRYDNGKIEKAGTFKKGIPYGTWFFYDQNGTLRIKGFYKKGNLQTEGLTGSGINKLLFKYGKNGKFTFWDKNGIKKCINIYKKDVLKEERIIEKGI